MTLVMVHVVSEPSLLPSMAVLALLDVVPDALAITIKVSAAASDTRVSPFVLLLTAFDCVVWKEMLLKEWLSLM